jgi:hypothetical protein
MPTLKIRIFVSFAIIFCFILSNSIGFAGDSDGIQQKKDSGIKTAVANKLEEKSLSNQEDRQCYSYRYYPSCSVYYDIHRGLYYYPEGDDWHISTSLSSNLERQLGDYVKIEMDTDTPYIDHKMHVQSFPPKESPKIKPNIWSKLFFVLLYEHASK